MAIKRNKNIEKLNLDNVWTKIMPAYQESKAAYKKAWSGKFKVMIVLFILGFLPGLIYWFAVWRRGADARHKMANDFISSALEHIVKAQGSDGPWTQLKGHFGDRMEKKLLPLPMGKLASIHNFFNWDLATTKAWDKFFKNAFYDTEPTPGTVSEILIASGLIAEVTGRKTLGKAVLSSLTKGIVKGNTISLDLLVETSANISMELRRPDKGTIKVNLYNLQTTIIRVEEIVKDGKKQRVTVRDNSFSGVVALVEGNVDYPADMLLKTKTWDRHTNKRLVKGYQKLKYDLASTEFNDNFKLMVTEEKGPALRKAFQPRSILALQEIEQKNAPFVLTNTKIGGLVLAIEGLSKYDLPLYIERTGKFFRKGKHAKRMLEDDLLPLISVTNAVTKLIDTKFIK